MAGTDRHGSGNVEASLAKEINPLPDATENAMDFLRRSLRTWIALVMFGVLLLSLAAWYFTSNRLPREIRIATGAKGGLYYRAGELIGEGLRDRTGRSIRLIETKGSIENRDLLLKGEADLAIFQDGAGPFDGLAPLAPLFADVVMVIVRKESGIRTMRDLAGRSVAIGPQGSGMRESALHILKHYRIELAGLKETDRYFGELLENPKLDAAIITSGIINPDLMKILNGGKFELLADLDCEALNVHHPFFRPMQIPRGVFGEGPSIPAQTISTVSTAALLTARRDAPAVLVQSALSVLYEGDMVSKLSILVPEKQAREYATVSQHPAARSYFDPYEGVGLLANLMESISAAKELLFAIGAGVYLLWDRAQRRREAEVQREVNRQKERLDGFLMETVAIEKAQYETTDVVVLQKLLKDVSEIKFRALKELTAEQLRGDGLFSIFLNQCNGVAREIDAKLLRVTTEASAPENVEG